MSVFRPSNINKRLVGTPKSSTGGSPKNAGQIGPTKTPYVTKGFCCPALCLGQRGFGGGGCCGGIFSTKESSCGNKELCCTLGTDCKGFFICCGPSTAKWFVAPECTQVARTYNQRLDSVTCANACMGACGWFVPSCGQLINPGSCCTANWDAFCTAAYWSNDSAGTHGRWAVSVPSGSPFAYSGSYDQFTQNRTFCIRAFRCTA